ncbi:MAG: polysaccharide deacetylase family protein [Fimbriimonas sp.]
MKLPILCYHKVGPIAEEGRSLNIEPSQLDAHVRFFARRNARFALARDLAGDWSGLGVCLTFDDAYSSTMHYGVEVLNRNGAKGTFYAVPTLVGQSSSWDGESARPLADWPALLAAQAAGHEIGNHSHTHPHLPQVDATPEVALAHDDLITHGIQPGSFCYPYGHWNDETRAAVVASGYKVGMALGKRPARPSDDRLALPRVVMACSDGIAMLIYKLYLKPLVRRG